jgi:FkbM family methyltransferase
LKSSFEEKIEPQVNNFHTLVNENDRWLLDEMILNESKGDSLFDKFILNSIKLTYKCIRLVSRIVLGKTRRDKLWKSKKITFRAFLSICIERLKLDNCLLLVFYQPNYNFKFYSRVTRKINNFAIQDVYVSMLSHEGDIVEHFTPKPGDVVIDVGAAFGLYSILASKMVGPKGKVVAIEPEPKIFQMLNSNIELNKLSNVKTLNYGAYSEETKLQLYSSYSVIPERAGKNPSDFTEVECKKLDNLIFEIENINEVNWIKIDVEGAELEVLKGATKILSKSKDISLLIEIHNISEGRNYYHSIRELLKNYGFILEFEKVYDNGERHVVVRKQ